MSEASIVLPTFGPQEWKILWFVLVSAFIALGYGAFLAKKTIQEDPGSQAMQDVAKAIEEGALAYLARQVKTMLWFVIAITIGLFFMYRGLYEGMLLPLGVALAFFMGVAASYGAGYVGMLLAVKGNVRTAAAALHSFKYSLEIAFRAGTVSGMFTVGLGLLGATIIFLLFKENAMKILVGFGFGGSLAALFMRMGGGIFTKAADVGADLVGKVEKGIPEDDPRNAATIADNVGDNVGDCAGMAADVFESYEVTLVAAIILGAGAMLDKDFVESFGGADSASKVVLAMIIYPLLIRAVGVFGSILGTWCVRGKDDPGMNPMKPINFGFWVAALSSVVGFWIVSYFYLGDIVSPKYGALWWRVFLANVMGIALALLIQWLTEYFTATEKKPVTEIAYSSRTGPATLILSGFAAGLESSVWATLAIAATIFGSYSIFGGSFSLSAYGIALAGLGLLATTGFVLAEDTFGPISDNANGIFEMSGALKNNPRTPSGIEAHRIVAKLDAVGNTTKALTKGLAIATAVIAAVSLFRSFIDEAHLFEQGIQVNLPEVFIGFLIGGAVPFLFSSFAIQAVSRAAFLLVEEVRRQFREKPGIMEFKEKPDYGRCVEIVTAAAQKELLGPGVLSIVSPILVAFAFGAPALGGFLAGAILTGQLMAVFLSNTGGAWDNAKKKIEEGLFGGKGTDCHKAAVIGDTVGDPFKDTAGPAINPMIKVMNLVAILIAPLAIREIGWGTRAMIVLACVTVLGLSVVFSKRGSIVEEEPSAATEAEASRAH
ncbi:MAG: sodium-translocating pyrophosphatase [Candidatus Methylomirabilis oxygeniifera]|uniref:K(+)-insensitive pyrophosphate-energized proton pump n=2 Tax=Candidatus Methylomirabilis TaxID=1170227 RepID=D5MFM9_METO1|nr:MAG: sodium-translocating pyrophosphatase [Candidatus Methylomirabilis oxyfera]CBE68560.1 H+ translocating pyrophosphate synthase (pyrophosphate-energized proton pump) (Pyrophosphate-energized inorganic pyrophosphatase) [Candidatus Methylomirabilis oxyfera]